MSHSGPRGGENTHLTPDGCPILVKGMRPYATVAFLRCMPGRGPTPGLSSPYSMMRTSVPIRFPARTVFIPGRSPPCIATLVAVEHDRARRIYSRDLPRRTHPHRPGAYDNHRQRIGDREFGTGTCYCRPLQRLRHHVNDAYDIKIKKALCPPRHARRANAFVSRGPPLARIYPVW